MMVSRRIVPSAAAAGLVSVAVAGAQHTGDIAQPEPPGRGGWDIGPRDVIWDGENSDVLVPPGTDSGTLPNLRFSFADAHNRPASRARLIGTKRPPAAAQVRGGNAV
jgi:oxalate decarboxylase